MIATDESATGMPQKPAAWPGMGNCSNYGALYQPIWAYPTTQCPNCNYPDTRCEGCGSDNVVIDQTDGTVLECVACLQ